MNSFRAPVLVFFAAITVACGSSNAPTLIAREIPASPTATGTPAVIRMAVTDPPRRQAKPCEDWQSFPVIPTVDERMRELYQRGQAGGNDPRAFSKIGDGEISAAWFFTAFDLDEGHYDLGPFGNLAGVIEYFDGSFGRIGMAARGGFNTRRILDPTLRDPALCDSGEAPLACELRLHRPAFAILSLGTNQVWAPEEFENGMRQIVEILLANNVVPILSTKGDNLEGNHRINRTVACLAQEYGAPLWNFWSAIQPLPDHGLQPDEEHLTYGVSDFDNEDAMQKAWTIRNLTALQALDAVWRAVTENP